MRWLFPDPDDRDEAAARKKVLARIGRWWDAFQDKTQALSDLFRGKKQWDLPGWMDDTLHRINPHLCWEYGPAVRAKGHRLVITPESRTHLRPLVKAILDRAPEIPGWEFYPYRLPEDLDGAKAAVEGRTGGSLDGLTAEVRAGAGNRIDLMFRGPDTADEEDREALNVAFVAAETLLGEEALDKWVGAIEVGPAGGKGRGVPLDRLKETFGALVEGIRDRLPDRPYLEQADDGKRSMVQLEPKQGRDYPGKADLLVAVARDVELFKAMHGRVPFYSVRFSRWKEAFAYVKMDGAHRRPGSQAEDRGKIEDALDEALARDGLGVHVGGGTGLRYSYIDLALTKRKRGVEEVINTLADLRVPRRSWVLFFDADLAAEWVGVYPDTPPPPAEGEDED